eukprot:jgi/Ulvmu1/936/UM102_0019.1
MAATSQFRISAAAAGLATTHGVVSRRKCLPSTNSRTLKCCAAPYKAYSQVIDRYLMLFLVQQDLGVQLQRAMNAERYDLVQEVQKRKSEIEKVMESQRAERDAEGYVSTDEGLDALTQAASLQAQMDAAVEAQDFALAATLRDKMRTLKEKTAPLEAAAEPDAPRLALGQRVLLRDSSVAAAGLAGVVVGWDRQCCEGSAWKERNGVAALSQGEDQVFYHLLLDMREWQANAWDATVMPVAYAADEALSAPADDGRTWLQEYKGQPRAAFIHPYEYLFFLGTDNRGDMVPTPQLRNMYSVPRRDVFPVANDDDGYEGGSDDSGTA